MEASPNQIFVLCDDIIFKVLEYLPLKDVLAFTSCHERFTGPLQLYLRVYFQDIKVEDLRQEDLSKEQIRQIIRMSTEFCITFNVTLNDLIFLQDPDGGFDFFELSFPNLKKLEMYKDFRQESFPFKVEHLKKLISNMPQLASLVLMYLDLNSEYFQAISQISQLYELNIASDEIRIDNYLPSNLLSTLKSFSLTRYKVEKLNSYRVSYILAAMPNLKRFQQRVTFLQPSHSLDELSVHCPELEVLDLGWETNFDCAIKLPKLKSLHFCATFKNMQNHFANFINEKKAQLKMLKIYKRDFYVYSPGEPFELTSQHFQIISQLKKLQILELMLNNTVVDNHLNDLGVLPNLWSFTIYGHHRISKRGLLEFIRRCRNLKYISMQPDGTRTDFRRELVQLIKSEEPRPNGQIVFLSCNMPNLWMPTQEFETEEVKKMFTFVSGPNSFLYDKHLVEY